MAVLKSFELNGNKQSFASWISNLSPCDIPFVSAMKKERVDQAHYSWQVDSLAPAIHTGYVEGSNFDFPARKTVEVMQNYTSILRKVVNVSDTAERIATHGRDSEIQYQMSKAGKEIMRDLELMVLHRVNGNPSMKGVASRFAGFEGLTAGLDVKDADTGAVTHKSVTYAELIAKEDLFDITYNLFLSGSKADKIMYHPKHAKSFSDLIGDNVSEPNTYRMFDMMDTTANFQVKRIKDPLGRFYTLIPNRFMPEDKIFFFNEDDWTQTVLRDPSVSKLGRKGSSERFLMEMEVGLRHRHPYASGILALIQVNMTNHLEISRDVFTAFVNDTLDVNSVITIDGVTAPGEVVSWHSSNEQVVSFKDNATLSAGSTGRAPNVMKGGFQDGTARVWTRCRGVKSAEITIEVRGAQVEATVDNDSPKKGDHINFTATVRKEDGSPL
ncbi:MAG: SU10 major capsid protein, partial [Bacteroidales bacterium]